LTVGFGVHVAGCASDSSDKGEDPAPNPLVITRLSTAESIGNVLAYDVSWKTSRASDTELQVACDGLDPWTISEAASTTSHDVFVMGLVSSVSCTLTARAVADDGASASATRTIDVGELPSYLPPITVTVPADEGALAPGWTLVNLSNEHNRRPYVAALFDAQGRYRWYYQYPTTIPGYDTPVIQYANGVVIGGRSLPMSYVDWQGELVWSSGNEYSFHHEVRPSETPDQFYSLIHVDCPALDADSDQIAQYDSTTQEVVWTWTLCDHYTPPAAIVDWSHMNAVSLFPDSPFLLGSSRNQNALFKLDRSTGDLIWVMGQAGEVDDPFNGDFEIAEADRFYHQHDATVLPNGNILLFDNGRTDVREFSRGLELAYTFDASGKKSEAHVVWEYRHAPDIFAPIWGGAQRFDNGNTLLCFGRRDPGTQTTIVEASADSKSLWEVTLPEFWGSYRAQRISEQRGFVIGD
jgi:Arylsulfotransferase (ASST)